MQCFSSTLQPLTATNTAPKPPERKTSYSSPAATTTTTSPSSLAKPTTSTVTTTPSSTTTANSGIRSYGGAKTMPNIPAVTEQPKPAETPATEQNVSEMTSSIVGRYLIYKLFDHLHCSRNLFCKYSKL